MSYMTKRYIKTMASNELPLCIVLFQVSYSMSWQKTTPVISAHDRDSGTGKQDIEFAVYG